MSRCHSPNSCPYRPTVPELPDTSSGCMISVDSIAYPISRGYLRWTILISYDIMISWYESWFIYIQVTYICVHQFSSLSHDMILTDTAARRLLRLLRLPGPLRPTFVARAVCLASERADPSCQRGSNLWSLRCLRTQRSQRRDFKNVTSLIYSDVLHYVAYFWMIWNDMFNGKTFRVMSTLFTPPL